MERLFNIEGAVQAATAGAQDELDLTHQGALLITRDERLTTTLAWRYAICRALRSDTVLFLTTDREKLSTSAEWSVFDGGGDALSRIHIRYVTNVSALKSFLAWFPHLDQPVGLPGLPECIVINNYGTFFADEEALENDSARCMALLRFALENIGKTKQRTTRCLITDALDVADDLTTSDGDPISQCFKYLKWILEVEDVHSPYCTMKLSNSITFHGALVNGDGRSPKDATNHSSYEMVQIGDGLPQSAEPGSSDAACDAEPLITDALKHSSVTPMYH
ncbi:uncharacterized protein EV422DRAFT_569073 [Fimicolochytrium jonesii]|uniref:uncharacterized protein n=1 Tax=Fimicolochytrium jonesii TaxID=1396493 RepID=UPI0022FEDA4A|nr:uncharacterized protein EV422DRAFT_569073 [Fimicolochytrium jonesii]KAI8819195.1 hypothetical protein EV422DRAFT_569073 [Fimicolochytrium jonesii]